MKISGFIFGSFSVVYTQSRQKVKFDPSFCTRFTPRQRGIAMRTEERRKTTTWSRDATIMETAPSHLQRRRHCSHCSCQICFAVGFVFYREHPHCTTLITDSVRRRTQRNISIVYHLRRLGAFSVPFDTWCVALKMSSPETFFGINSIR